MNETDPPARGRRAQRLIAVFVLLVILALLFVIWNPFKNTAPPNILFILIDTLRADHLMDYGYTENTAPNLGKLAGRGVLFERVIAPSSWTKTSMASIMTGRPPASHGVRGVNDILPDRLTTVAEGFSARGYRVLGVNTNPWLTPKFGFSAGFDAYETHPVAADYIQADKVNASALRLLEQHESSEPVFLYLHYMDVHAPYLPAPPFQPKKQLKLPGKGTVSDAAVEHLFRKKNLKGPGIRKRVIKLYDGEIRSLDAAVGKLFQALDQRGWLDNTLVVITSDHGEAFREHETTEHGWNLYPEVYEVPMILSWPGVLPEEKRIRAQVRSIDIAPTLFELTNLPVPRDFEGKSLMPLQSIQDRIAVSAVGLNDYVPELDYIAVISADHLYIREKINNVIEFYDLRQDPLARDNLGPGHPGVASFAAQEGRAAGITPDKIELDEETEAQLKSIGYLK